MTDTVRIKSQLPVALVMSEPHPDPAHPGNSPELKSAVLRPGVNEVDAGLFRAWKDGVGKSFMVSSDDVKAGLTDGRVYEMSEDESDMEFGFEPALARATEAMAGDASKGSTITEPGPVPADAMKPASSDAPAAPVLHSDRPLSLPATTDASADKHASMSDAELERATRPAEPAKV